MFEVYDNGVEIAQGVSICDHTYSSPICEITVLAKQESGVAWATNFREIANNEHLRTEP